MEIKFQGFGCLTKFSKMPGCRNSEAPTFGRHGGGKKKVCVVSWPVLSFEVAFKLKKQPFFLGGSKGG